MSSKSAWYGLCLFLTIEIVNLKRIVILSRKISHSKLLTGILAGLLFVSGCSDSGGSEPSAANIASVNAGKDLQVREDQNISLSAIGYPEGGTVAWAQLQGPAIAEFPTEFTLDLELVPPQVNLDTELVFEVTYTAPDGQVSKDSVTVLVTNINQSPVAVAEVTNENLPPFRTYESVTLSAANSTDPDGEIREYSWQQIDTNPPLEFSTAKNLAQVVFEAPFVSEITNYKLLLTVTDNFGLSDTNILDVQIAASQASIAANAGEDQTVDEFTKVTLDGSESISSVSDVTCQWQQTSGSMVTFANSEDCKTEFVAPDVDSTDLLVFELTVKDNGNNTAIDQTTVAVNPLNLGNLHDTGVTECYDEQQVITCGNEEFPKQDADTGRDAVRDVIDKSGSGQQAFDFTKFDANGDEISNDALVFSCVRDNFTGLIWEVKQPTLTPQFGSLRGVENYYSFDDSALALSSCPSVDDCGVEKYVETVNEQTFCGGANWRLPTYLELMAIMNYGDLDADSLLDPEFFPYSPNSAVLGHKFYWVSDASAEGGAEAFNWVLDIATGDDAAILLGAQAYVRLVRRP